MANFAENLGKLKSADQVKEIVLYDSTKEVGRIPNIEGKKGSIKVYSNLLGFEDGLISQDDIKKGLELFAEHTEYQIAHPEENKHPNIGLLLNAKEKGTNNLRGVITFDIPNDLESRVRELHEVKKAGQLESKREIALDTFNQVMNLLERGHLRTAQYSPNGWKVNDWVKQGILLGFPLGANMIYGSGDVKFVDKATLPLRKVDPSSGIRVVPPAAGLRRGSYAGEGCIFMPPAYANVGSFIGRGTMIENLVGSCAQVGKNSHISAGAIIGGVLDPIEATPVILGDYVLMGEGSGVTQGTRLGDLVTLAPGVHISKGTPVIDPINGVAYTSNGTISVEKVNMDLNGFAHAWRLGDPNVGEFKDSSYGPVIPNGALIVPGLFVSSKGSLRIAPTVAKYISSPKERAYDLNEDLRK